MSMIKGVSSFNLLFDKPLSRLLSSNILYVVLIEKEAKWRDTTEQNLADKSIFLLTQTPTNYSIIINGYFPNLT